MYCTKLVHIRTYTKLWQEGISKVLTMCNTLRVYEYLCANFSMYGILFPNSEWETIKLGDVLVVDGTCR